MSDLLAGLAELDAAAPDYAKAEKYYKGTVAEVFASPSLATRLRRSGERYKVNFAKTPVNVAADRLEISSVTVANDDTATKALQADVWDANRLALEMPGAIRKTCMYGDGYLVVWEGDADGAVDVWFNSPLTSRMIYDPENPRRKLYFIKRWKQSDKRLRVTLYYADRVERWINRAGTSGKNDADWVEYVDNDGDAWPIPNPYGEVPAFHLRTDSPYGVPVHLDAYGPQDALNKIIITMMSTTDYAGAPLRYALMEANARLDGNATNSNNVDPFADDTTKEALDKDTLPLGPGDVWLASGLKGVGQLDPADPKNFLDPAEFLIRAMAQTTTTPLHYFDPSGDQPSGESLRAADAPLVKRVGYLSRWIGSGTGEALSFGLKVIGLPGRTVTVRWTPANSSDDQDSWTVAKMKIDAGVPVRQVLIEQGYASDLVDVWIAANGEDNLRERIKTLSEIAKAVQTLGTAMTLGAVSDDQVRQAVDQLLLPAATGEADAKATA